jgi:ABC-2 type transport system permease protein
MGGGAVLTGTLLFFFLVASLEMVAFWADHVWSLLVMLRFILYFTGGGMIPLSLFPDYFQSAVSYLPFPYLASFPIRCFMGRVGTEEYMASLGIMAVWIVITAIISRLIWRSGLKRYSGVGI